MIVAQLNSREGEIFTPIKSTYCDLVLAHRNFLGYTYHGVYFFCFRESFLDPVPQIKELLSCTTPLYLEKLCNI